MQRVLGLGRILGGEAALRRAMGKHTGDDHVLLDLGEHKIALNLRDPRFLQAPNELLDPHGETALLHRWLSPGDTFIDIGANHGSFAIAAAQVVGPTGRLIAVEPQPRLADLLELSLRANARGPFELLRLALGDTDGSIDLFIPNQTSGRAGVFASYSAEGLHQRVTVPLKRFDDAVNWRDFQGKTFIKLDIEGSELAFLRGAAAMVRHHRPRLLLEVNPASLDAASATVADLRDLLTQLGYTHFARMHNEQLTPIASLCDTHTGNILVS
jgi:FkbM family methyltransferase